MNEMVFLLSSFLLCRSCFAHSLEYDGKVRDVGDGRSDAYMIPPYKSNHASFLEITDAGTLFMAWFSGSSEGANNCSIVVAHLVRGSTQWSNATLISRRDGYSNQNPVLYFDTFKTNTLNLFHTQQKATLVHNVGNREDNSHIWTCQSVDETGTKWTDPKLIFERDGSFDRNRIIKSLSGGLIYPIYYSVDGNENQYSAMKLSSDHVNWKGYTIKDSNYLVQPSVIRPTPNQRNITAFFRDRRAQHIYSASSTDEGQTWTKPEKTALPNNNAAIQATVLISGNVAIVFNPTTSARNPIHIALSKDSGRTWPHYRDLEYHSALVPDSSVEYSYPSILQSPDGFIHVSYTYNRETIKYSKFKEEWISKL